MCTSVPFMDIESWGFGTGDCLIVTLADFRGPTSKLVVHLLAIPLLKRIKSAEYRQHGFYPFKRQVIGIFGNLKLHLVFHIHLVFICLGLNGWGWL